MVRPMFKPSILCSVLLCAVALPGIRPGRQAPAVTVKAGDTLWELARQYLSDPFLWPDIYRLNTLVVEDPHWIYPGEVLRLASSDAVSAVPTTDTPPVQPDTQLVAVRQPAAQPSAAADTDATEHECPVLAEPPQPDDAGNAARLQRPALPSAPPERVLLVGLPHRGP